MFKKGLNIPYGLPKSEPWVNIFETLSLRKGLEKLRGAANAGFF